jgi:hypothetical protein
MGNNAFESSKVSTVLFENATRLRENGSRGFTPSEALRPLNPGEDCDGLKSLSSINRSISMMPIAVLCSVRFTR